MSDNENDTLSYTRRIDNTSTTTILPNNPPTNGDKQRLDLEFYQTYDVMTGVRIAATLGTIIGLFGLFILYKSKCSSDRFLLEQYSAANDSDASPENPRMNADGFVPLPLTSEPSEEDSCRFMCSSTPKRQAELSHSDSSASLIPDYMLNAGNSVSYVLCPDVSSSLSATMDTVDCSS